MGKRSGLLWVCALSEFEAVSSTERSQCVRKVIGTALSACTLFEHVACTLQQQQHAPPAQQQQQQQQAQAAPMDTAQPSALEDQQKGDPLTMCTVNLSSKCPGRKHIRATQSVHRCSAADFWPH